MKHQPGDSSANSANGNSGHEVPIVDPIVQPAAGLVDENHDADKEQDGDNLKRALHAANIAFERMNG